MAVLLSFSWTRNASSGAFFARATVQSGTAVYIAIVGIVYSVLLRQIWNPQGWQKLADALFHHVIPLLYVAYWAIFVRKSSLLWKDAVWWLTYPAAYFAFTLLRGLASGWYPHPFLDANALGYSRVSVNAVMLLAAFRVAGLLFVAIGRWVGRSENRARFRSR
ncbi:MAG TPA: Pr6Pr family membrane protein [Candidatus Sulfotelmatobacter sp.]